MADTEKLVEPVHDALYMSAKQAVRADADTVERAATLYSAQTFGSATLADPLNATSNGKTTIFVLGNNASNPFRFNDMALRMRMVMHLSGNTAATAPTIAAADAIDTPSLQYPYNCPSWNMVGAMINQVKLTINDCEVWSSVPGHYSEDFTARLLANYSYDVLDGRDDMLFTPAFDERYTAATARAAAAVTPAAAGPVNHTIKPSTADAVNSPFFSLTYTGGAAPVATAGFTEVYNPWASATTLSERCKRWMGAATHQKVITKTIPFCDLFPRFNSALFTNVRSIKIEILWTPSLDLLEHFSSVAGTQGDVSIIGCDIWSDSYTPTSACYDDILKSRQAGESEKIGFQYTQVYALPYTAGSDLMIPGISNFAGCMIMQPARGFGNGQAAAALRTYTSFGQTLLFGNSATAVVGDIKQSADTDVNYGAGSLPITSVQLQYSGRLYPSNAIITAQTVNGVTTLDPAPLYHEYRKFCAKAERRDVSVACPYWAFKGSMPFIALRPFADGVRVSNTASDLFIRLQGGVTSTISIIVFRTAVLEVNADGMCQLHK